MQTNLKNQTIITAVLILVLAAAMPIALIAEEKERLADINAILTAYGCIKNGKYNYGSYVVTKVSLLGNTDDISQIEGMKDLLDTPEEFITASYYSQVTVINEMREILQKELPQGKIGGLRLASMWLKKCAENRNDCGKYKVAIDTIKEKSKLSENEIRSYFNKAMENEVNRIAEKNLGVLYPQKLFFNELAAPIIAYYREPNEKNEDNLIRAGAKLFDENKTKADGFFNTLIRLNDGFATKIINKIHELRSKKAPIKK